MEFVGLLIVLVGSSLIVVIAVTIVQSIRRQIKGISKDYAEQIVKRRFAHGRTIGTRFARERSRYVWEFDVMDGEKIHRVWVDARTAAVIKAQDVRRGSSYPVTSNKVLGKRIG